MKSKSPKTCLKLKIETLQKKCLAISVCSNTCLITECCQLLCCQLLSTMSAKYKVNIPLPKMKPSSGILQEACFMQALTESLLLNPCSWL